MSNILEQIAAFKRLEVEDLKAHRPLERFIDKLPAEQTFSFREALTSLKTVKIIAELKKASPSKGILVPEFNPESLAAKYKCGGAVALSVLTDSRFFQGQHEYMCIAKKASSLPILCKDFIIDPYQLYYARHMEADAVLLIARLLTRRALEDLHMQAHEIGLDCLVEVHSEGELEIALEAGAQIIGVNSRNLQDFTVSLETTKRLAARIPADRIKVAESGIFTRADIIELQSVGYDCFLIGEALLTSPDPIELLHSMQQV